MTFDLNDRASAFLQPSPAERRAWPTLKFVLLAVLFTAVPCVIAYILGALVGAGIVVGLDLTDVPFKPVYQNVLQDGLRLNANMGTLAHNMPDMALMAMWSGGLLLALKLAYRLPARNWLTSAPRFRWRPLVWGLLIYFVIWAVGLVVQGAVSTDGYRPDQDWLRGKPWHVVLFLGSLPIVVLVRAAAEEIIFRGWIMRQVRAVVPSLGLAILVSALMFALVHGQFDPLRMVQLFTAGLAFAWVAYRTGGLEWGIGLHTGWNLAIHLLADEKSVAITSGMTDEMLARLAPKTTAGEWAVLIALPILAIALTELVLRTPRLRAFVGLSSSAAAAPLPSGAAAHLAAHP